MGYGEELKYDRGRDCVGESRGTISRGSSGKCKAALDMKGVKGGELGAVAYGFDREVYVGA